MCGFTGWLSIANSTKGTAEAQALLRHMTEALRLRGPNDEGFWLDCEAGIALGHRRLAVVDLSAAGHQPMASASGRYVLAYNGEVYNHGDLRAALTQGGQGPAWRGHSDTETLLAAIEAWGFEQALQQATGMFAIALWDRHDRRLMLARDRFGEKPLYWGWQGGHSGHPATFLFGSELKALQRHPAFNAAIDRDALALLLRHNCIGEPHSIFQGIRKLEPGTWLEISATRPEPVINRYWSSIDCALNGQREPFTGSETHAIDEVERLLGLSIGRQMLADVPVGAFLSGGIDSSTVAALMQAQSPRPIKTFTIGFHEPGFNEAAFAKSIAAHLGTDHTELYVGPQDTLAVIPKLPTLYSEPFADSSQIPTFLVSQMARQQVAVSLSGDGGDELFCGYERYRLSAAYWRKLQAMPLALRRWGRHGIECLTVEQWNRVWRGLHRCRPTELRDSNVGDKLHKAARLLGSRDMAELYRGLVSHWEDPASVVLGAKEPVPLSVRLARDIAGLSGVEQMMLLDLLTYLPGDVLTKVDRAAMGVSLETRLPMLDHQLVEFAWRLPMELKLRQGITKWPLRQVLYRHVPRDLIDRPKRGFAVPIAAWLRGPLRDWAEDLLSEHRLREDGYFEPTAVRRYWHAHLSGKRNYSAHLWNVLMFQSWLTHQSAEHV